MRGIIQVITDTETEQAFKTTNETNTSFSINLEKAYSDNDVWKIGFKFKDKTKMRDDIWYEYDNDLSNMDGVNYFDASIPDYLIGDTYQSGYFVNRKHFRNVITIRS